MNLSSEMDWMASFSGASARPIRPNLTNRYIGSDRSRVRVAIRRVKGSKREASRPKGLNGTLDGVNYPRFRIGSKRALNGLRYFD